MASSLRGALALLSTVAALGACTTSEMPPPPEPEYVPKTAFDQRVEDFGRATEAYSASVALLQKVPSSEDHRGVRHALELLAAAVDKIPRLEPAAAQQAASLMRDDWVLGRVQMSPQLPPPVVVKRTLQYALGAFRVAAEGRYAGRADLDRAVAQLGRAVDALDEHASLDAQRLAVMDALQRASTVLRVIGSTPEGRAPNVAGRPTRGG